MPVEIPGYYFDEERKKYFKIEKSHTAPSSAAWSSEAVKRRKVQDTAREAARQRAWLVRNHIRRHEVLRGDIVSSGLLARELRLYPGSDDAGDVGCAAWAGGLADKGAVPFVPSFARERFANMPCFYVSGEDEKTGLGVAYATLDEETLIGSYIAMDQNDRINFHPDAAQSMSRWQGLRAEMIRCPQMSSIKYHAPSHRMLLTSREPDHSCGLYFFSPPLSSDHEDRPHWLLGETSHYQRLYIRHRLRDEWLVHQCTPAPASSDLLCVIGTNAGILRVRSNDTMDWISAPNPSAPPAARPKGPGKQQTPREIFDQDFQAGNHNVLLAGGRQPRLWTGDLRAAEAEWSYIPHASSVAHLRSVNEHQVLVAGLQSSMCMYDLRFGARNDASAAARPQVRGNSARPMLVFDGYKNEAHFHTGWDVDVQLGVVAAAHDDGTVKLFSLGSGRVLRRPEMVTRSETPVRALMFRRMPREKMASLWVGEGPSLRKFSFGVRELGDEV